MWNFVWILLLVFLMANGGNPMTIFGKRHVDILELSACKDEPALTKDYVTVIRNVNGKKLIDVNVTLPYPMDSNMKLELEVQKMSKGKWVSTAYRMTIDDACDALSVFMGQTWIDLQEKARVPQPGKCPLPKGRYQIKDYEMKLATIDSPSALNGKIRFRSKFIRKSQTVLCCVSIVEIK